ncbi:polysaccharide deacetylase family protein [Sulfurimonas sediminis]|uniref:Polysaccharide deacetylase family protein n=1 Tax=Sulfurimonas sediminis TaxID=2590020 RepID=A0A7M1B196_9BACT|nr:polysaccharide deacetylase family protein [Sulfurimonas sediminis]QOP43547.1 polysaccharide deacetylase family protein [Sulfurimonas sediminis]
MKILIHYLLVIFLLQSSLLAHQNHAVVLQYHRFDEDRYPSTSISMELFTQQMQYLADNNYTVWPFSKTVKYLLEKKELPDKTVSITIDDGYRSVYTKAYPLLKKYKFPFTVFVNSAPVVHESVHYLTWDEMREMGKYGAEYANHTYSHQFLVRDGIKDPKNYKKHITKEIEMCEAKIEKELGAKVCKNPKILAYPFGEYDLKLMNLVKSLGYIGVAQNSGPISSESNFMALTRFPMSGGFGEMDQFRLKINTLPLPIKNVLLKDTLVNESNNPPSLTLTLKKPLKNLQCFTADGKKIAIQWLNNTTVTVQAQYSLEYPRNHYTCTAHAQGNAWYWYSHLWIVLE